MLTPSASSTLSSATNIETRTKLCVDRCRHPLVEDIGILRRGCWHMYNAKCPGNPITNKIEINRDMLGVIKFLMSVHSSSIFILLPKLFLPSALFFSLLFEIISPSLPLSFLAFLGDKCKPTAKGCRAQVTNVGP